MSVQFSTMNKYFLQNIIFFFIINSGNFFNYLFQIIIGRNLSPEEYGEFNSLNSLAVIITIFLMVIPTVLAKYTVTFKLEGKEKVRGLLFYSLKIMSYASVIIFILGSLSISLIMSYLKINSILPIVIMLITLGFSAIRPVPLGILQGLQHFVSLSLSTSSLMVIRFLSGFLFVVLLGWSVNGALLAGLLGGVASLGIGLYFLKNYLFGKRQTISKFYLNEMFKFSVPVLLTSIAVGALGNIDLVLVRHYCLPAESGFYATAAILGRIAFYLPGILIFVLFPSAAKSHAKGSNDHSAFFITMILTGLIGGGFTLICLTWAENIILFLYGANYVESVILFKLIAFAMALLAISNVFFTFCLAKSNFGFIWILFIGLIGMFSFVFIFHDRPVQIAQILLGTTAFIITVTCVWFFSTKNFFT